MRRLTLWLRSRASGTRRAPAPSHLAQRDVAKTCYPGKHSPRSNSKQVVQSPWRRANCRTTLLGGRAPIAQGGPIWRKPDCEPTTATLYSISAKFPRKKRRQESGKWRIYSVLRMIESVEMAGKQLNIAAGLVSSPNGWLRFEITKCQFEFARTNFEIPDWNIKEPRNQR